MVDPVAKAEKKAAKDRAKNRIIGEEEEKSAQDILMGNLPMVIVVCVLFSLIPVAWTYYGQVGAKNSQQAWTDYGDASTKTLKEAGFEKLLEAHGDTTAAPYIKIKWAAKLYDTGEKANVEKARDLLKQVKRDHSNLDLVSSLLDERIAKIEAELASERAVWVPAKPKADVAPTGSAGP